MSWVNVLSMTLVICEEVYSGWDLLGPAAGASGWCQTTETFKKNMDELWPCMKGENIVLLCLIQILEAYFVNLYNSRHVSQYFRTKTRAW